MLISDQHERAALRGAAKRCASVNGPPPPALRCDVTDEGQVQALIAGAIRELGHIDVLINNAGLGGFAPVVEMRDEQWFKVLDVTLTSVFRMTRAVLPHMIERRSGAIVNNASVLGWRAQKGQAHYAAAKAGVMAFTRCVALEAAEAGVRVNAVSPSLAMHEFLSKVTPDGLLEELVGARGVRARGRALGGRERDGLPRERLRVVHDRRGRRRQQSAPVRRRTAGQRSSTARSSVARGSASRDTRPCPRRGRRRDRRRPTFAVSPTIRGCASRAPCARIRRVASTPSISGISTSMSTRS